MATVSFMKRIIMMTAAEKDQDHIHMVVEHCPSIPDRTGYILDHTKENPAPAIIAAGHILEAAGVDEIAIPCVTAHFFHHEISAQIRIPVMDGVALCAEYLQSKNIRRTGIMATDGSVRSGVFEEVFRQNKIECIYPSEEMQHHVMELIYDDVKSGRPVEKEKFQAVADELFAKKAEVVLLGCTELSVIADEWLPEGCFLDALSVLARKCVLDTGKLKPEFQELLTK